MVDYCNYKMSGSEEEHELHVQTGMSKAELRRSNKPIMEKRRRARINQCLDELKFLILEAMKKDPSRHSKLEKADILEMTVKHLQAVQRQQLNSAVATDPAVLTKFRSGFSECATETSRYVSHLENVDPVVKQRLVSHLNNCVSNLQQMAPFYSHYVPYMPERLYPEVKVGFQNDFQNGDENNNASARIQIPNGVQLIPSRLPTGELALLLSQSATISANFPFFPTPSESISKNNQSSAFIAMPRPQSPLLSPSSSTSSFGEENQQPEQLSQVHSPVHHNRRLKNHGRNSTTSETLNSSPETQKPQISSTSDSKSPVPILIESKADSSVISRKDIHCCESLNWNGQTTQSLRQPLSVITDKAYNRSNFLSPRKESLKRCSSDGFLAISDKKPKICVDSIKSTIKSFNTNLWSAEDQGTSNKHFLENTTLPVNKESNYSIKLSDAGPSGSNSDMWRPW